MDPRGPTEMTDRGWCPGIAHRLGVSIGCLLGTGIIVLVLLWIVTVVLDLIGVVV